MGIVLPHGGFASESLNSGGPFSWVHVGDVRHSDERIGPSFQYGRLRDSKGMPRHLHFTYDKTTDRHVWMLCDTPIVGFPEYFLIEDAADCLLNGDGVAGMFRWQGALWRVHAACFGGVHVVKLLVW